MKKIARGGTGHLYKRYSNIERQSYRAVIAGNQAREGIMRSILSRPNASFFWQIMQDMPKEAAGNDIYYHLRVLRDMGVIHKDDAHADRRSHANKRGSRTTYSINHRLSAEKDAELQRTLRELFPDLYDAF